MPESESKVRGNGKDFLALLAMELNLSVVMVAALDFLRFDGSPSSWILPRLLARNACVTESVMKD